MYHVKAVVSIIPAPPSFHGLEPVYRTWSRSIHSPRQLLYVVSRDNRSSVVIRLFWKKRNSHSPVDAVPGLHQLDGDREG